MAIAMVHLISGSGPNRKCDICGRPVTDDNGSWVAVGVRDRRLATCALPVKVNWSSERAQVQIVIDGAEKAAMGDSNDAEIQCLQDALEESVDLLDRALARIAELEAS